MNSRRKLSKDQQSSDLLITDRTPIGVEKVFLISKKPIVYLNKQVSMDQSKRSQMVLYPNKIQLLSFDSVPRITPRAAQGVVNKPTSKEPSKPNWRSMSNMAPKLETFGSKLPSIVDSKHQISKRYIDFVKKTYEKEKMYASGEKLGESDTNRSKFSFSKQKMQEGYIEYIKKNEINEKVGLLSPVEIQMMQTEYEDKKKQGWATVKKEPAINKQVNELKTLVQKKAIPQVEIEKQDAKFMAQKSNMSKVTQKRMTLQKLNFAVLAKEDFGIESPAKLKFNKELFGDERMLQSISKIAIKQTKQQSKLEMIRAEERLFKTSLLERKLNQGSPRKAKKMNSQGMNSPFSMDEAPSPGQLSMVSQSPRAGLGMNSFNAAKEEIRQKKIALFSDNESDLARVLTEDYTDVRNNMKKDLKITSSQGRRYKMSPRSSALSAERKDAKAQKVPEHGLLDVEFREKQYKFNNSLYLLEQGLQGIIQKEKSKYNKWKREQEKEAAKQLKFASGYRKTKTMMHTRRGSTSPKKDILVEDLNDRIEEFPLTAIANSPISKTVRFTQLDWCKPDFEEENEPFMEFYKKYKVPESQIQKKQQKQIVKSLELSNTTSPNKYTLKDQQIFTQQVQNQILKQFIAQKIKRDGRDEESISEEMNQILQLAVIETGNIELFEYSLWQNPDNADQLEKYAINQSINNQMAFLSKGLMKNSMFYNISMAFQDKVKGDIITKFNKKSVKLMGSLIFELMEKLNYFEIKNKFNDQLKELDEKEEKQWALQVYVQECAKNKKIPLPIFQKIFDKKLILKDYFVNLELIQAVSKGMAYNPQILDNIYINNCGMNENITAEFLKGATELDHLQSFTFINQEVGLEAVKYLNKIMFKSFPFQLQTLKLINCKLSNNTLIKLLECMIKQSFVKNFALMHQKQSTESLELLCTFLRTNVFIKMIDLAWNQMTHSQIKPLLDCLAENDQLQEINLSHNKLFRPGRDNCGGCEQHVTECIKSMIIKNQQLIHLFLNNCGLSFKILMEVLPYMKFSPSLVAVHLSNNLGISDETRQDLVEQLDIQVDDVTTIDYRFEIIDERKKMNLSEELKRRFSRVKKNSIIQRSEKFQIEKFVEDEYKGEKINSEHLEQIQTRRIFKERNTHNSYIKTQDPYVGKIFVIQRYIGFDEQLIVHHPKAPHTMPSKWKLILDSTRKCWCCERYIYSLLFWNANIGLKNNLIVVNKDLIVENLKPFPYKTNRPVIYSFNNYWQGQEMHTISEFCFIIDKHKGSYMKKVPFGKVKDYQFSSESEQRKFDFDQALYMLLQKYRNPKYFRKIIHRNLDYRDAQFINCNDFAIVEMQNFEQQVTYVLPQYLAAGRYQYIIEYPKGKFYMHKAVIHYRTESVPIKLLDQQLEIQEFIKNNSVFAEWREDTPNKITECYEHDIKLINLQEIKKSETARVKEFINHNFIKMKEIYINILSLSQQVEGIDDYSIIKYLNKYNFKIIKPDVIKECFWQVLHLSKFKIRHNSLKSLDYLCRKEFIELFVQLAIREYEGTESALNEMLDKLLTIPIPFENTQGYRENNIWTTEVNDVLSCNLGQIKSVLRLYQKTLSFQCLVSIFMHDSKPPIVSKRSNLVKAAVLAKQTVINDFQIDQAVMSTYSTAEFLELLCRVVEIQSENTKIEDLFLEEKLSAILMQLIQIADKNAKCHHEQKHIAVDYKELITRPKSITE